MFIWYLEIQLESMGTQLDIHFKLPENPAENQSGNPVWNPAGNSPELYQKISSWIPLGFPGNYSWNVDDPIQVESR